MIDNRPNIVKCPTQDGTLYTGLDGAGCLIAAVLLIVCSAVAVAFAPPQTWIKLAANDMVNPCANGKLYLLLDRGSLPVAFYVGRDDAIKLAKANGYKIYIVVIEKGTAWHLNSKLSLEPIDKDLMYED